MIASAIFLSRWTSFSEVKLEENLSLRSFVVKHSVRVYRNLDLSKKSLMVPLSFETPLHFQLNPHSFFGKRNTQSARDLSLKDCHLKRFFTARAGFQSMDCIAYRTHTSLFWLGYRVRFDSWKIFYSVLPSTNITSQTLVYILYPCWLLEWNERSNSFISESIFEFLVFSSSAGVLVSTLQILLLILRIKCCFCGVTMNNCKE